MMTAAANGGKGLEGVEMGAMGAGRAAGEILDARARVFRVEALDETERRIGQERGDEHAPEGDGHVTFPRISGVAHIRRDVGIEHDRAAAFASPARWR